MLSNAELVKAVLGGDRAAFAALVQRYERAVLGVATSVLEDHHAAQDAAQEAFMVAYRRLDSLRNGSTFGAWLLRITHRQAVRMARQRSRAAEVVRPADDPAAERDGRLDDALNRYDLFGKEITVIREDIGDLKQFTNEFSEFKDLFALYVKHEMNKD